MEPKTILSTRKLQVGYNKVSISQPHNLQLYSGELVVIIGQNGCGKSTLIRTLAGLQKPIDGYIKLNDTKLNSLSNLKRARMMSLVLTDKSDVQSLTIREMVAMGRIPHTNLFGKLNKEDNQIIDDAIEMVHMTHKKDCLYTQLSDGEKQRTNIARAIAQDTEIILLDEPTSHLDLPNKIEIMLLLARLAHETGKAILLSSHELEFALQTADKIWLMTPNGIECGIPEDMVLEGRIEKSFNSNSYIFDKQSGVFLVTQKATKKITLAGYHGTLFFWTERALIRNGYELCSGCDIKVEINEKPSWTIKSIDGEDIVRYNLENLLYSLNQI